MNSEKKRPNVFKIFRYITMALVFLYLIPQLFFKQEMAYYLPSFLPTFYDLCPFGIVDSLNSFFCAFNQDAATLEIGLLTLFIFLFVFTFFFGRIFCGFICPLGTIQEFLGKIGDFIFNKILKCNKPKINRGIDEVLKYCKYALLISSIVIAIAQGKMLFDLLSDKIAIFQIFNPWIAVQYLDVPEILFASYIVSFISLILLLIGSIIFDRFFCRYFCMAGALYSIAASLSPFKFKYNYEKIENYEEIEFENNINIAESIDENIVAEEISDENPIIELEEENTEITINCADTIDIEDTTEEETAVDSIINTDTDTDTDADIVSDTEIQLDCYECDKCIHPCPNDAIDENNNIHTEDCIMCGTCAQNTSLHFFNFRVSVAIILLPLLIFGSSIIALRTYDFLKSSIPSEETLKDFAKSADISVEEYIKNLGYDDPTITGKTTNSDLYFKLLDYPIEKSAPLLGLDSVDIVIQMYNLPEDTPKNLTFRKYRGMATIEKVAEVGDLNVGSMTVEEYIDYYQLPSTVKGTDKFSQYESLIDSEFTKTTKEEIYSQYSSCCLDYSKYLEKDILNEFE